MNRILTTLRLPPIWQILAGACLIGVLPFIIDVIPTLLVGQDDTLTPEQRLKATNDARTSLAQIVGAIGLFGTLLLTARTFLLSRTGQVTGRFEAGINQLGDDNITVRIGGIFALEQLAREGKNVQQPIVDVLASFIRERAGRQLSNPHALRPSNGISSTLAGDIQAALVVLGRRDPRTALRPPDLHEAALGGADLQRTRFQGVQLAGAMLNGARFTDASLEGAFLQRAWLRDANLSNANLTEADLTGADLTKAVLYQTNFAGATLKDCVLSGCDLSTACNLSDAQRDEAIL